MTTKNFKSTDERFIHYLNQIEVSQSIEYTINEHSNEMEPVQLIDLQW